MLIRIDKRSAEPGRRRYYQRSRTYHKPSYNSGHHSSNSGGLDFFTVKGLTKLAALGGALLGAGIASGGLNGIQLPQLPTIQLPTFQIPNIQFQFRKK